MFVRGLDHPTIKNVQMSIPVMRPYHSPGWLTAKESIRGCTIYPGNRHRVAHLHSAPPASDIPQPIWRKDRIEYHERR
jgi:hypothetical protein